MFRFLSLPLATPTPERIPLVPLLPALPVDMNCTFWGWYTLTRPVFPGKLHYPPNLLDSFLS
jgi:hypothetical protein